MVCAFAPLLLLLAGGWQRFSSGVQRARDNRQWLARLAVIRAELRCQVAARPVQRSSSARFNHWGNSPVVRFGALLSEQTTPTSRSETIQHTDTAEVISLAGSVGALLTERWISVVAAHGMTSEMPVNDAQSGLATSRLEAVSV